LLPQTVPPAKLREIAAAHPAAVGVLRDVHVTDDPGPFRAALREHYRAEIEAWWGDTDTERQLGFIDRAAVVGDAAQVAAGLDAVFAAGAAFVVTRLQFGFVPRATLHAQIAALADHVAPRIAA